MSRTTQRKSSTNRKAVSPVSSPDWFDRRKLYPPQFCVSLVERSNLSRRLDDGLAQRINLIYAPPGYGKTTLLSQWYRSLQARDLCCVWLSLDNDDAHTQQFLLCIAESLILSGAPLAVSDTKYFEGLDTPRLRSAVLQALSLVDQPTVIILDDYHYVSCSKIDELLSRLIRASSPHVHFSITTRFYDQPGLSSLRLNNEIYELGPEDLCFSIDDIQELCNENISKKDLKVIHERTKGWPVAVQVAIRAFERSVSVDKIFTFTGGEFHDLTRYVTEHVMQTLPDDITKNVIESSILDQMNGDILAAMLDMDDGWAFLHKVQQLTALVTVPQGEVNNWYTYHPLFLEYLRAQLPELGEDRVRSLNRVASRWFFEHGELQRGLKFAIQAGEQQRAADIVESAGGVWLGICNGGVYLRQLLEQLPVDLVDTRPRLRIARAFLWLKEGKSLEVGEEINIIMRMIGVPDRHTNRDLLFLRATHALQNDDSLPEEDLSSLRELSYISTEADSVMCGARYNLLGVMYYRNGALLRARQALTKALTYYDQAGVANPGVWTRALLSNVYISLGELSQAGSLCREAEILARDKMSQDAVALAVARTMLGSVAYLQNDIDTARRTSLVALPELEHCDACLELLFNGYQVAASLVALKRSEDALLLIERGRRRANERGLSNLESALRYLRLDFQALYTSTTLEPDKLREMIAEYHSHSDAFTAIVYETSTIALARMSLKTGEIDLALELLEPFDRYCIKNEWQNARIRCSFLLASCYTCLNKPAESALSLYTALEWATPGSQYRIFLDDMERFRILSDLMVREIGLSNFSPPVLNFITQIFVLDALDGSDEQILKRLFSERELEVLDSLAKGNANKVIARQLQIAEDTVKYHLKKVFAKLGVNNRNIAAQVARNYRLTSAPETKH